MMGERYNWPEERQKEHLLFSLNVEAINFAASFGLGIRENTEIVSLTGYPVKL